jgi:hypothetical protein
MNAGLSPCAGPHLLVAKLEFDAGLSPRGDASALVSAHCETAPDGFERRVTRAKQVSPTPGGGANAPMKRGGQAKTAGARPELE